MELLGTWHPADCSSDLLSLESATSASTHRLSKIDTRSADVSTSSGSCPLCGLQLPMSRPSPNLQQEGN